MECLYVCACGILLISPHSLAQSSVCSVPPPPLAYYQAKQQFKVQLLEIDFSHNEHKGELRSLLLLRLLLLVTSISKRHHDCLLAVSVCCVKLQFVVVVVVAAALMK